MSLIQAQKELRKVQSIIKWNQTSQVFMLTIAYTVKKKGVLINPKMFKKSSKMLQPFIKAAKTFFGFYFSPFINSQVYVVV